jgi:hypothetical protein
MANSWQSPVASEPSLGTPHPFLTENTATLINQNPCVAGTWYTATFSTAHAGDKAIVVSVFSDTVAQEIYWRPGSGSSTWTQARQHIVLANPTTGVMMVQALIWIDGSKQAQFSSSSNGRLIVWEPQFYDC